MNSATVAQKLAATVAKNDIHLQNAYNFIWFSETFNTLIMMGKVADDFSVLIKYEQFFYVHKWHLNTNQFY